MLFRALISIVTFTIFPISHIIVGYYEGYWLN